MSAGAGCAVPTIDISPFLHGGERERAAVARQWDEALSSVGAAYITGHGCPKEVTAALEGCGRDFFGRGLEEKMSYCLGKGYGSGGYVPQGVEAVARSTGDSSAPPDLVENFVFSHGGDPKLESVPVPSEPQNFHAAVGAYWREMDQLLQSLMELSATALGLHPEHFRPCFVGSKCSLRLGYYPALAKEEASRPSGAMRYGAHTDYTGFTILRQDPSVSGLEVQTVDGAWHAVPPQPDAFVVNAGDLIQVWTNDRWRSPPHRVVNPPVGSSPQPRLSLVFFTGPSDEAMVEALPGTFGPDRPKRYDPVSAGEHLLRKLQRTSARL